MAMGRSIPPPEEAESWGEFNARLELEAANLEQPQIPLWWIIGGLLFGIALVSCAYAFQGGHWWLWLCMLAPLGALGVMATRAVERADRKRAQAAELARLRDAWLDQLERGRPTPLRGDAWNDQA
jgi:peptidoglycan/LPS O-acetylase OafA/YrhL